MSVMLMIDTIFVSLVEYYFHICYPNTSLQHSIMHSVHQQAHMAIKNKEVAYDYQTAIRHTSSKQDINQYFMA
jgi:hypothetical protein